MLGCWADFGAWRKRRRETVREAQERGLEREARKVREAFAAVNGTEKVEVRWGLDEDEAKIAELLELNGMPRWVAFEERFVVAAKPDGRVVAAVRYRSQSKRLVLGLLVADPWGGERRLAAALYSGAADLAREIGACEVFARPPASQEDYPRGAGYRRRGRGWGLDARRPPGRPRGGLPDLPEGGWRRWLALWGAGGIPFFRAFRD